MQQSWLTRSRLWCGQALARNEQEISRKGHRAKKGMATKSTKKSKIRTILFFFDFFVLFVANSFLFAIDLSESFNPAKKEGL